MSRWTDFAKAFYQKKKKGNPKYKFSTALKEASKFYKKDADKKGKKGKSKPVEAKKKRRKRRAKKDKIEVGV